MKEKIVGLDIGTSNVRVVIAETDDNGELNILGMASRPSEGVKDGMIRNMEAVSSVIKETIEAAELEAGTEVTSCVVSISGPEISCHNTQGFVPISKHNKPGEVTEADVDRVIENARAVPIPPDKDILHVIPKDFGVDNEYGIKNPINYSGVRLSAEIHMVIVPRDIIQNINNTLNRAGYELDRVMQNTLAATQAVVQQDETELGSIVIDLGAGNTDVMLLYKGAPLESFSINIGGNLVTGDISIVKGTSFATAEEIKLEHGCSFGGMVDKEEDITIPGLGGRQAELASRKEICEIIQARMEEIFMMVKKQLMRRTDLHRLDGNIILTGGGAKMEGVLELAKDIFKTTAVRIGFPERIGDYDEDKYRSPEFATVIGLIMSQTGLPSEGSSSAKHQKALRKKSGKKESIFTRLKKAFF